eukprot:6506434-Alexandrium_andersonii.AAC.1
MCWASVVELSPSSVVSIPVLVGRFGICKESGPDRTSRELQGPILRTFLGPCSSSSERLNQFCIFGRVDCGARRI